MLQHQLKHYRRFDHLLLRDSIGNKTLPGTLNVDIRYLFMPAFIHLFSSLVRYLYIFIITIYIWPATCNLQIAPSVLKADHISVNKTTVWIVLIDLANPTIGESLFTKFASLA